MKLRYSVVGTLAFLIVWEIASAHSGYSVIVPIEDIVKVIPSTFLTFRFVRDVFTSLRIMLIGITCSILIGELLAILSFYTDRIRYLILPIISFFKSLPTVSMIPIIVGIFGIKPIGKVMIIFMTGFTVTYFNNLLAIDKISKESYVEAGIIYGCSKLKLIAYIILPNTLPDFINSLKLSISYSFVSLVASEMLGANWGIGYRIQSFSQSFMYASMILYIITISLLSLIVQGILTKAINRFTRFTGEK